VIAPGVTWGMKSNDDPFNDPEAKAEVDRIAREEELQAEASLPAMVAELYVHISKGVGAMVSESAYIEALIASLRAIQTGRALPNLPHHKLGETYEECMATVERRKAIIISRAQQIAIATFREASDKHRS